MNLRDWYYKQIVTQGDLDEAFEWAEDADREIVMDLGFSGIVSNYTPTETPTPGMAIRVGGPGVAFGKSGERIQLVNTEDVDASVDEYGSSTAVASSGNEKYISLFVRFARNAQDPVVDGNGVEVYTRQYESYTLFIRQGAEAAVGAATKPALLGDALLIGDVLLSYGQTEINTGDILKDRREDFFRETYSTLGDKTFGDVHSALQDLYTVLESWSGSLPFTFGQQWAGSVDVAGPAPPPNTMQKALDAIVYDLAKVTTDSGLKKIGAEGYTTGGSHVTWGDTTAYAALVATADAIDGHVAGGAPNHAATAITFSDETWITGATVQAAFASIVTALASQVNGTEGASRIGVSVHDYMPSGTLQAGLEAIIEELQKQPATGASGSDQVGVKAISVTSGTLGWGIVQNTLTQFLQSLINIIGGNSTANDGASRVGFYDGTTPSDVRSALQTLQAGVTNSVAKSSKDYQGGGLHEQAELIVRQGRVSMLPKNLGYSGLASNIFGDAHSGYPWLGENAHAPDSSYQFKDIGIMNHDFGDGYGSRPGIVYVYSTGPTGNNFALLYDPHNKSAGPVISTNIYASAGVAASAAICDGSALVVMFDDDTLRRFAITGGAFVEDTSFSWPVSLPAGGVASDQKDALCFIGGSNIFVVCGALAMNAATGPFIIYNKEGVQQSEGPGGRSSATEYSDGGICYDGTDVYVSTLDGTTARVCAVSTANCANGGSNGPWAQSGNTRVRSLLWDGRAIWVPARLQDGTTAVRLGNIVDPSGTPDYNPLEFKLAYTGGTSAQHHPLYMVFDGMNVWCQSEDDDTNDYLYIEKFPVMRVDDKNDNKESSEVLRLVDGWASGSYAPARMLFDGIHIHGAFARNVDDTIRVPFINHR